MIHTAPSRSNSDQRASMTSPDRHAVRIRNSKGARRHGRAIEPSHECGNLGVWHCGMMAALELLAGRQDVLQMPAPERRVFARAPALGLGEVQHALDAPPNAGGGLAFGFPDRRSGQPARRRCRWRNALVADRPAVLVSASFSTARDASRCAMTIPSRPGTCRRIRRRSVLLPSTSPRSGRALPATASRQSAALARATDSETAG